MIKYAALLLMSTCGIFLVEFSTPRPSEDQKIIAIRTVGHKLLLHTGDSASQVLPVERIGPNNYELRFNNSFKYSSDTLINIIQNSFSKVDLAKHYLVKVMDCETADFMYGYHILEEFDPTVIPCTGREQPEGCYFIHFSFKDRGVLASLIDNYFTRPTLIAVFLYSILSFVLLNRKKTNKKEADEKDEFIPIGKYNFYTDRNLLKYENEEKILSAKETKLLSILSSNPNQIIKRQQLLDEVWEGVIVGRSLDVFISKLRKHLKQDPDIKIVNAHGEGYKLEVINQ